MTRNFFSLVVIGFFSLHGVSLHSSAKAEDEIVLVSPHWEGIKREFEGAFDEYWFQKTNRHVTLRWLDLGGTIEILKYLASEFQRNPESAGVDLLFGGGIDSYIDLKSNGYLTPTLLPSEFIREVPPLLSGSPIYDLDGTWYSSSLAGFGILTNTHVTHLLKLPSVQTWQDLDQPQLYSFVGCGDPRRSGSAHMTFEIILQAYGWDLGWKILYGIAANARAFTSGSSQIIKDVAVGEVAYGLLIDSYARESQKLIGKENSEYVIPTDLSVVAGEGIARIKGGPHPELAEEFLKYVLSEAGQRLLAGERGSVGGPKKFDLLKLPVRPSLYDSLHITHNPFKKRSTFVYDSRKASSRWQILNDLFGVFLIEAQSRLQEAQRMLGTEKRISDLLPIPIEEIEVQRIVQAGLWKDAAYRGQALNQWGEKSSHALQPYVSSRSPFRWVPISIILFFFLETLVNKYRWKRRMKQH